MIHVDNWSQNQIEWYGRLIGEAFAASPGIAETVPKEDIVNAFVAIIEGYYRMGTLCALSDNYEGFLAYWDKKIKMPASIKLRMVLRMIKTVKLRSLLKIAASSNEQYVKLYKDADDYIAVSMIVVLRQYQGQGYMKKILEPAFQEADKRNCPCILDTDSPEKVAKYERCGMKKVAEKQVGHGVTLYTMEYKNMA